jgi:hypothetical protein
MRIVLILGSGPDVVRAQAWPRTSISDIVAINNAWRVRPDWDYLIHPEDFPADRMPTSNATHQTIITAQQYVPAQNNFGGFIYAGPTMAFTAGYWALDALKPDVIAFLGCDMQYEYTQTHFYGKGTADPLRPDVTLQSLEAKSTRLMVYAALNRCLCLNLSDLAASRQVFSRTDLTQLSTLTPQLHAVWLERVQVNLDKPQLQAAQQREVELNYLVPSGRTWEVSHQLDSEKLRQLDALWLASWSEVIDLT